MDTYYRTAQRREDSPPREDRKGNSHLITVSRARYKRGSANYIVPNVSNRDDSEHELDLPDDDETDTDEDEENEYEAYAADRTPRDRQLARTTRSFGLRGASRKVCR